MSKVKSKAEIRDVFLSHIKHLVHIWNRSEGTSKEKLEGLAFSIMSTIDGVSGGFPCAIDLVMRPHEDDKQYNIDNGDDYNEDGTCINDDTMLHEVIFK